MPKISVEIMKTIDERELKKTEKQKQKGARGTEAIVKRWELNDFFAKCKSFEFRVSLFNYFKTKRIYESKHVAVKCRCVKMWDLLSFLICSSILVLKWWQVSPI